MYKDLQGSMQGFLRFAPKFDVICILQSLQQVRFLWDYNVVFDHYALKLKFGRLYISFERKHDKYV